MWSDYMLFPLVPIVTSCFQMNDNSRTVTGGRVFKVYKYVCGYHLQSQRETSEHLAGTYERKPSVVNRESNRVCL